MFVLQNIAFRPLLLQWLLSLVVCVRAHNEGPRSLNTSPQWNDSGWELRSHPGEKSISVTHGLWHSWKRENIFCLWFMFFPSGIMLVDSLNCPSRAKKHSTHKINIYFFVFFSLSALEYVFWWSVSLHDEGKWWVVSYYIPLAGIGFYFPEEYLCSVKTLIKNLQWVVKGLVCAAAAVTTVIFPLQKLTSKQQQSFTGEIKTFIIPLCTLRLRFSCSRSDWNTSLIFKNNSYIFLTRKFSSMSHLRRLWLDCAWMWWDYESHHCLWHFRNYMGEREIVDYSSYIIALLLSGNKILHIRKSGEMLIAHQDVRFKKVR